MGTANDALTAQWQRGATRCARRYTGRARRPAHEKERRRPAAGRVYQAAQQAPGVGLGARRRDGVLGVGTLVLDPHRRNDGAHRDSRRFHSGLRMASVGEFHRAVGMISGGKYRCEFESASRKQVAHLTTYKRHKEAQKYSFAHTTERAIFGLFRGAP